jgi:hypothetical protein
LPSKPRILELIDHFTVASDESYISGTELELWKKEIHECLAILNGFINYLIKAKERNVVNEPVEFYNNLNEQRKYLLTDN